MSIEREILDWSGAKVSTIVLSDEVFGVPENSALVHEYVRWLLASRRAGTHSVRSRGLVSGGGKKPFKQKGTGNARQGSNRSPLMPGGGKLFGPVPRDYSYNLPDKVKQHAARVVLSQLVRENEIRIVDSIKVLAKTKEYDQAFSKQIGCKSALLVDQNIDLRVDRATRNLKNIKYVGSESVNAYDLLKFKKLVISKSGLSELQRRLSSEVVEL